MVQTAGSDRGPWGHLGGGHLSTITQTRPRGRPAFGRSLLRVCGRRRGPSRGPSPLAAVGARGLSSEPRTLAGLFLTALARQKLGLPRRPGPCCPSWGPTAAAVGGGFRRGRQEGRRGRWTRVQGRAGTTAHAQPTRSLQMTPGAFPLPVGPRVRYRRLQENGRKQGDPQPRRRGGPAPFATFGRGSARAAVRP